jgi:hypothetical protein
MKAITSDCCWGDIAIGDTVEAEIGSLLQVISTGMAAPELAFLFWEPGLLLSVGL